MSRQRKKKGRPVSGWLVLDKPFAMGSTEAVSKVKWLYMAEKAGHAGTLDPLASGLLPIAFGEATKTVPYVQDGSKTYRFTVAWGAQTTTDDLEGQVIHVSEQRPTRAEVEAILPNYTGVIQQVPPQFSAIKIEGERAYDLARGGEAVEIPAREVEIGELVILDHAGDHTVFETVCGKGTYVRSLARDFGRDLGCFGHVSALRRTGVSPFSEEDAVPLAELEAAMAEAEKTAPMPPKPAEGEEQSPEQRAAFRAALDARFAALDAFLIDPAEALSELPQVPLSDEQAQVLRMGNPVILRGRDAPLPAEEAAATLHGKLIAIGEIAFGEFRPRRVFKG